MGGGIFGLGEREGWGWGGRGVVRLCVGGWVGVCVSLGGWAGGCACVCVSVGGWVRGWVCVCMCVGGWVDGCACVCVSVGGWVGGRVRMRGRDEIICNALLN